MEGTEKGTGSEPDTRRWGPKGALGGGRAERTEQGTWTETGTVEEGSEYGALGPRRSLEEGPHKGSVEHGTEKGHWGRTGHWKKGPKKALPGSAGGAGAQTGRGGDDNNEDRDVVFWLKLKVGATGEGDLLKFFARTPSKRARAGCEAGSPATPSSAASPGTPGSAAESAAASVATRPNWVGPSARQESEESASAGPGWPIGWGGGGPRECRSASRRPALTKRGDGAAAGSYSGTRR